MKTYKPISQIFKIDTQINFQWKTYPLTLVNTLQLSVIWTNWNFVELKPLIAGALIMSFVRDGFSFISIKLFNIKNKRNDPDFLWNRGALGTYLKMYENIFSQYLYLWVTETDIFSVTGICPWQFLVYLVLLTHQIIM